MKWLLVAAGCYLAYAYANDLGNLVARVRGPSGPRIVTSGVK